MCPFITTFSFAVTVGDRLSDESQVSIMKYHIDSLGVVIIYSVMLSVLLS